MQDHVYMLLTQTHVPKVLCATVAFLLGEFMTAQSVVVVFTALNAILLVCLRIRVKLGCLDWKLLVVVFGLPCVMYAPAASVDMLGSNGAW